MKYVVSAYDQFGNQFGDTIDARDTDELFDKFVELHEDCDIADYFPDEPIFD